VSNLTTFVSLVDRTDVNLGVSVSLSESRHLTFDFLIGLSSNSHDIELSREVLENAFHSWYEVTILMINHRKNDSNIMQVDVGRDHAARSRTVGHTAAMVQEESEPAETREDDKNGNQGDGAWLGEERLEHGDGGAELMGFVSKILYRKSG
jgi:hypothetical protein